MSIDVIGIILAILFFVKGYSKGLIVALCSVIALLLGVVCAVSFSAKLALYLQDKGWASGAWAPLISYVVLFFAVLWGVRLLAKLIDNLGNTLLLGWPINSREACYIWVQSGSSTAALCGCATVHT